tara:strand:+ start:2442 stop:2840 length:399 start_codon:yes stop_codon:yes gene_type:complete
VGFKRYAVYYSLSLFIGSVFLALCFAYGDAGFDGILENAGIYFLFSLILSISASVIVLPLFWWVEAYLNTRDNGRTMYVIFYWVKLLILFTILSIWFDGGGYETLIFCACYGLPGFFIYLYFLNKDLKQYAK